MNKSSSKADMELDCTLTSKLGGKIAEELRPLSPNVVVVKQPVWALQNMSIGILPPSLGPPDSIRCDRVVKHLTRFVGEVRVSFDVDYTVEELQRHLINMSARDFGYSESWFDPKTLNLKYTSGIQEIISVQPLGKPKPKVNIDLLKRLTHEFHLFRNNNHIHYGDVVILCSLPMRDALNDYKGDVSIKSFADDVYQRSYSFRPVPWLPDDIILVTTTEGLWLGIQPGYIEQDRDIMQRLNVFVIAFRLAAHFMSPAIIITDFNPKPVFVFSVRSIKRRYKLLKEKLRLMLVDLSSQVENWFRSS